MWASEATVGIVIFKLKKKEATKILCTNDLIFSWVLGVEQTGRHDQMGTAVIFWTGIGKWNITKIVSSGKLVSTALGKNNSHNS